jgi:signal transduction histidine kinase
MIVMNRTRDQFVAVLGHDLRSPLSAIFMTAGLLARGGDVDRAAAQILRSGERMARMVDDLLDLTRTRMGSGIPITPLHMDLEALCEGLLSEFQVIHPDRKLEFHSEGDLRGKWDEGRIGQVLSNLVGNALQHGDPGKPIGVTARADARGVVLEVHNEGVPIPPALLANIFEPMVSHARQGEAMKTTSLGLGLHIAREVVLAHGGTLVVTSDLEGTTFTVHLPHHSVSTPAPAEPADRSQQDGNPPAPARD